MTCFGALLREYRHEAAEVLISHPRLAAELEFDLRKPLGPSAASPVNMMKTPAPKIGSIHRRRSMTPKSVFAASPRNTPASAYRSDPHVVHMPSVASQKQWNICNDGENE